MKDLSLYLCMAKAEIAKFQFSLSQSTDNLSYHDCPNNEMIRTENNSLVKANAKTKISVFQPFVILMWQLLKFRSQ